MKFTFKFVLLDLQLMKQVIDNIDEHMKSVLIIFPHCLSTTLSLSLIVLCFFSWSDCGRWKESYFVKQFWGGVMLYTPYCHKNAVNILPPVAFCDEKSREANFKKR